MKNCTCSPECIYFPREPSQVLSEYLDEFGIKRRNSVFLCGFDDHRIIEYIKCENFKSINSYIGGAKNGL